MGSSGNYVCHALVLALALLGVSSVSLASVVPDAPVLTLNSTRFCVGASWRLNVSGAMPGAAIDLSGTMNNAPWAIPRWADTDANGNFSTSGTYARTSVGRYTLLVEIAGTASNILPVEIAACGWSATGSVGNPRDAHAATLLANGKVLVVGGNIGAPTATAELYDPTTGQWSAAGIMSRPRWWPIAVRLANGKVLVAGGFSGTYGPTEASAEIYDPDNGTWTAAASMSAPRAGHSASLLSDGRVLVTGGSESGYFGGGPNTAELYDPITDSWGPAGTMNSPRDLPTATLLPDGRLLVAGGIDGVPLRTAEIYDPATGSWTATGDLITLRVIHTATLLHDGKVLVAGGGHETYPYNHGDAVDKAELYDPATGRWSSTGNMTTSRAGATATLLPDGKVLVAGGFGSASFAGHYSAELYDPASGTWSGAGVMNAARNFHTATLLANGQVLVVGGSSDLYDPGLAVPLLTLNSTRYCVGDPWNLAVTYPTGESSVNLLGISNGASWRIDRFGAIDSNGSFKANGTFSPDAAGTHILRAEIQGVWSADVALAVSNCRF